MRYKEFNRVRVLEKCILLFWDNGFRGTPISKIVDVTRVNRFSLYSEFDDKHGLLYHALDHYRKQIAEPILEAISYTENEPVSTLKSVFSNFLRENPKHPSGCFIIHIATELADENEKIQLFLDEYLTSITDRIYQIFYNTGYNQDDALFLSKHLTSLFCTSMCFSLLQSSDESIRFVENCIDLIINQKKQHA